MAAPLQFSGGVTNYQRRRKTTGGAVKLVAEALQSGGAVDLAESLQSGGAVGVPVPLLRCRKLVAVPLQSGGGVTIWRGR